MSPSRCIAVLILLTCIALPAGAHPVPTTEHSATYSVVWDPSLPIPNLAAIERDLTPLALAAAKEKLDLAPQEAANAQHIYIRLAGQAFTVAVGIDLPLESPKIAQKKAYFEAVGAKLTELVQNRQAEMQAMLLQPRREAVDKVQAQAESLTQEARKLRNDLRKLTGRLDTSPEGLRAAIASFDQENQKLALDSAGLSIRRKMLQETIAELTVRSGKAAEEDPVAKQLEAVVVARENEAERIKALYKNATVSASDVGAAEAKVAEARARLLERRSNAARSPAGHDALTDFNRELLTVSINLAENQARQDHIAKVLNRYTPVADEIDQLESLLAARGRLEQSLIVAQSQLADFDRQISTARRPYLMPPVLRP